MVPRPSSRHCALSPATVVPGKAQREAPAAFDAYSASQNLDSSYRRCKAHDGGRGGSLPLSKWWDSAAGWLGASELPDPQPPKLSGIGKYVLLRPTPGADPKLLAALGSWQGVLSFKNFRVQSSDGRCNRGAAAVARPGRGGNLCRYHTGTGTACLGLMRPGVRVPWRAVQRTAPSNRLVMSPVSTLNLRGSGGTRSRCVEPRRENRAHGPGKRSNGMASSVVGRCARVNVPASSKRGSGTCNTGTGQLNGNSRNYTARKMVPAKDEAGRASSGQLQSLFAIADLAEDSWS